MRRRRLGKREVSRCRVSIYNDSIVAVARPPLCRRRAFQLMKNEAVRDRKDDSGARTSWMEVRPPATVPSDGGYESGTMLDLQRWSHYCC